MPDHPQKKSENIITSDGLLSAPGTSNAFENEDKMEVSYYIANEDDLLGKSDDHEQIPLYQVPRKPKQFKQQRQSYQGTLKGVPANQGQNSTEKVAATAHPQRIVNGAIAYPRRTRLAKPKVRSKL